MSNNTIVYRCGNGLYLNITNRCPCSCDFCIRNNGDGVNENESLWLTREPTFDEIKKAIEAVSLKEFEEVVFCGYGEPTERLDVMIEIAKFIKARSDISIRLNTNGLGELINNKQISEQLSTHIDSISISLNAPTKEAYNRLCKPEFGEKSFDAMLDFARSCKKNMNQVFFTIVDVLEKNKIEECKTLCNELGIPLTIRPLL